MIHIFGYSAYALIAICSAVLLACINFLLGPVDDLLGFISLFAKSGIIVAAINIALGNYGIFQWLISRSIIRKFVPQIHGEWRGHVTTNFYRKAQKMLLEGIEEGPESVPVTAIIRASLFDIIIELKSDSGYLESKTRACRLVRDGGKHFELSYVTKNTVQNPKESDEQFFHGAGFVRFEGNKPASMSGSQWTNRNWQKCLNTAGNITLHKV